MAELPITSITAAIAAVMLVVLGLLAGTRRTRSKILLGTSGDDILLRRVRAHGNFTEYVPTALILLALTEAMGSSGTLLWTMAGLLIVGRALHIISILGTVLPARATGMVMTLVSILIGAGVLLSAYL